MLDHLCLRIETPQIDPFGLCDLARAAKRACNSAAVSSEPQVFRCPAKEPFSISEITRKGGPGYQGGHMLEHHVPSFVAIHIPILLKGYLDAHYA